MNNIWLPTELWKNKHIYIYIRRPLAQARGGGEREGQSQSLTLRKNGSKSSPAYLNATKAH